MVNYVSNASGADTEGLDGEQTTCILASYGTGDQLSQRAHACTDGPNVVCGACHQNRPQRTQAQNASAEDLFLVASRSLDVGDGGKMRDTDPLSRGHLIALLLDLYAVASPSKSGGTKRRSELGARAVCARSSSRFPAATAYQGLRDHFSALMSMGCDMCGQISGVVTDTEENSGPSAV